MVVICDGCGEVIESADEVVSFSADRWDIEYRTAAAVHDDFDCLAEVFDSPSEIRDARSDGTAYEAELKAMYPDTVGYLGKPPVEVDGIETEFVTAEELDIDADEIVAELDEDDHRVDSFEDDKPDEYEERYDEADHDVSAVEKFTDVSGVDFSTAVSLRSAGYESVHDLRDADQSELAEIPAVGNALAARIKADVSNLDVDGAVDADEPEVPSERKFVEVRMPDNALYVHTYEPEIEHARYEAMLDVCGDWKEQTGASAWLEELAQEEAFVVTEGRVSELTPDMQSNVADGSFFGPVLTDGTVGYDDDEESTLQDWKDCIDRVKEDVQADAEAFFEDDDVSDEEVSMSEYLS